MTATARSSRTPRDWFAAFTSLPFGLISVGPGGPEPEWLPTGEMCLLAARSSSAFAAGFGEIQASGVCTLRSELAGGTNALFEGANWPDYELRKNLSGPSS